VRAAVDDVDAVSRSISNVPVHIASTCRRTRARVPRLATSTPLRVGSAVPFAPEEPREKIMAKTQENKTETKFAGFIASKKLDARRILIASRRIEANRPEDRLIRLKKRLARAAGDAAPTESKETRKPRSGRPVTGRALQAALEGGKTEWAHENAPCARGQSPARAEEARANRPARAF
jgi:hypothetical protein